jgi:3-deoxy-D-manno-octulosonate 8-phosphate phosphatase (KDO 8-P phosphatase)
MDHIISSLESQGAQFVITPEEMKERLKSVRVFLFDWDGVFNDGSKYGDLGSPFAEADSMGINLVRLSYWLHHERNMPIAGIITGASNEGAEYFARREGLDVCIRGFTNKRIALKLFLEHFNVFPEEIAFFFDDVLDLPFAERCGLRFCINRIQSPAFLSFIKRHGLVEYISANTGGQFAVREICELILSLQNQYERALEVRCAYDDTYQSYLKDRNSTYTHVIKH